MIDWSLLQKQSIPNFVHQSKISKNPRSYRLTVSTIDRFSMLDNQTQQKKIKKTWNIKNKLPLVKTDLQLNENYWTELQKTHNPNPRIQYKIHK